MMISVRKLYKLSFFSFLVLSLLIILVSCQQETVLPTEGVSLSNQELWDTKKFDEIINSMNYDENSIDISQNDLIYYGFSAYYLYVETGVTDYLNKTKSALERFRLLYGEEAKVTLLSEVHKALALTYYYLGNYDKSLTNAEITRSLGIDDSRGLQIILGLSYYLSENYAQSLIELSKINNPSFSLNLLLYNLSEKSDMHPQLIEYLNSASDISDNELEQYISNMLLVNYYNSIDQYNTALDTLDLLQNKVSSSYLLSSLFYQLGISYSEQGDYIEARTMWNRSLEYNSDNSFTLDKLSK